MLCKGWLRHRSMSALTSGNKQTAQVTWVVSIQFLIAFFVPMLWRHWMISLLYPVDTQSIISDQKARLQMKANETSCLVTEGTLISSLPSIFCQAPSHMLFKGSSNSASRLANRPFCYSWPAGGAATRHRFNKNNIKVCLLFFLYCVDCHHGVVGTQGHANQESTNNQMLDPQFHPPPQPSLRSRTPN